MKKELINATNTANIYGLNEYSVQYDGDDLIFQTIQAAKDFIDTL